MYKKIFLLALCLSVCSVCMAGGGRGFRYSGYSGGMMLHTGWLSAGNITVAGNSGAFTQKMSGMPTGVGGAMKIRFGDWFRFGTEGYVSTLRYGDHGSNARVGWGGLLVDAIWHAGRLSPFAGVTFGGGNVRNLTLGETAGMDFDAEKNVSYRKYSFLTAIPFAGVEYAMTSHMHIVLKVDWMTNLSNRQPDFPRGPRIYIGFAFFRGK